MFDPALSIAYALLKAFILKTKDVSDSGNIETIQKENARQEASLQMIERQAKVMQEVAIAKRIATAEEVSIEEHYDGSGEGNIGVQTDGKTLNLGVSGKVGRISKRIYTFKGVRNGAEADIVDTQASDMIQSFLTTQTPELVEPKEPMSETSDTP